MTDRKVWGIGMILWIGHYPYFEFIKESNVYIWFLLDLFEKVVYKIFETKDELDNKYNKLT